MPPSLIRTRLRERKNKIFQQKISWFSLILAIIFWALLVLMIIFVDPDYVKDWIIPDTYLLFFLLISLSLSLSFFQLFHQPIRSLIYSLSLVAYLYLRLHGLGHYLNALLLVGLVLVYEFFFAPKKPKIPPPRESIPNSPSL